MTPTAQPAILRPKELKENVRGGGARTTPLVTRKCGSTSMINGITAFDGGASIGLHKHNCEESVMALDGHAIAEIDGVQHRLGPNDTTWIPANIPHRFINASENEPMRIFWIYASIDATRTMIATGEDVPSTQNTKQAEDRRHGVSLHRVVENPSVFRLLVKWETMDSHMVNFRNSENFQEWRRLVSPYFNGPPSVTHSESVAKF